MGSCALSFSMDSAIPRISVSPISRPLMEHFPPALNYLVQGHRLSNIISGKRFVIVLDVSSLTSPSFQMLLEGCSGTIWQGRYFGP